VIDDRTYLFAAQGGARDAPQSGSITLATTSASDLATLAPVWTSKTGAPVPSLRPGFLDPAPNGNAGGYRAGASFDRDYAGGGPTWRDPASGALFQVYHGEYHAEYPKGQPFYTALGLAISRDSGRSFRKLGITIRPEIPPDHPIAPATTIPTVPSSSGSVVKIGRYLYLYYSDLSPDGTCDGQTSLLKNTPCITVARIGLDQLGAAAQNGQAAPWRKYYHGSFTTPGIGGRFTPLIVTAGATWARWPVVVHDAVRHRFLMVYVLVEPGPVLRTEVDLRESSDGLHWSPARAVAEATAPEELNYPGIAPIDAKDIGPGKTSETGRRFDVIYVRELNLNRLGQSYTRNLEGVRITTGDR
jgi:hypothetical protein